MTPGVLFLTYLFILTKHLMFVWLFFWGTGTYNNLIMWYYCLFTWNSWETSLFVDTMAFCFSLVLWTCMAVYSGLRLYSQRHEFSTFSSAVAAWWRSNQHNLQQHYCVLLSQSPKASGAFHQIRDSSSHIHNVSCCMPITHALSSTPWLNRNREILEFACRGHGNGSRVEM